MTKPHKIPISVLVILHDGNGNTLLIKRADHPDFWQSVTGSLEMGESLEAAAVREVAEETGIELSSHHLCNWHKHTEYEIYPYWRYRYPEGTIHNTEHWFSACINRYSTIKINLTEHTDYIWLPLAQAAEKVFSPSNQAAILMLQTHLSAPAPL